MGIETPKGADELAHARNGIWIYVVGGYTDCIHEYRRTMGIALSFLEAKQVG